MAPKKKAAAAPTEAPALAASAEKDVSLSIIPKVPELLG
jgi:hypothetical protein